MRRLAVDGACSALRFAAENGHVAVVTLLGQHSNKYGLGQLDQLFGTTTALCGAARYGELDVVRELLSLRAGVDVVNGRGQTPLMLSAMQGHTDIVRTLLDANANVRTPHAFITACTRRPSLACER